MVSAAKSLANSADSQDRTADVVEEAAELSGSRREELRATAARHRSFAQDDRRMAEQLRRTAGEWLDSKLPGPPDPR